MSTPRPYRVGDPGELERWIYEVTGYLRVCELCGTDEEGRRFALDAAPAVNEHLLRLVHALVRVAGEHHDDRFKEQVAAMRKWANAALCNEVIRAPEATR